MSFEEQQFGKQIEVRPGTNREQESEKKVEVKEEKIPLSSEYIEKLKEFGSEKHVEAYERMLEIAKDIKDAGGQALLVGGCVRDMLLGQISKDFDLEVYRMVPHKLEELVRSFGKVSDVGKSFGVLKISFGEGVDIDISLPRTDSKIGVGHKGFEVKADPDMSIIEAARRRDFTINSMAADPLTGKIHDPFGGIKDLRERRLKVTDPERFKDDPLRVMRAMQFIGRFGLELAPESSRIIQEMAPQLKELPHERIFEEWKKLLLKAEKPSMGLTAGMALGILKEIHPEFPPLAETPQTSEWHPEGDVWIHTLMAVDEAARIVRRENLNPEQALVIMLSTLSHDLGKPLVTELKEGRYTSHGHEKAGEEPSRKFLKAIGADNLTCDKVIKLITNHLIPSLWYIDESVRSRKVGDGAIRRLANKIHPATIAELVMIAEADYRGRGALADPETPEQLLLSEDFPAGDWLLKRARDIAVEKSRPTNLIRGRDLLNFGYQEGPNIGKIIDLANQLRDGQNFTSDMVFRVIDGTKKDEEAIERLKKLLAYD